MRRRTGMPEDRHRPVFPMAQSIRRLALLLMCLSLLGAPCGSAQTGVADVLPGAFGESIDSLDAATRDGYAGSSTPLFEYLGDAELTAFAENFEADFPVSVFVRHDGEIGGVPRASDDPEAIRAVFEALSGIAVLGESPISGHTDDDLNYYFEMADGRMIYGWTFQGGMLLDDRMGLHEITGYEALQRALPDPGL